MRRRDVIALLSSTAILLTTSPPPLNAQQAKVSRIGYLSPGSAAAGLSARDEAFRQGLRERGYVEGETIFIEYRFADGDFDRLDEMATELVELQVDVLVAVVTQASLAAKRATDTIPIVMVAVSDPIGSGLVTSLARPSANVTGTSSMTAEVIGKSLELLREAVPTAERIAVLWNPSNAVFQTQLMREAQAAAASLGVQLLPFEVRGPEEFEAAFASITKEDVGALWVLGDPMLIVHREAILKFAGESRLPAMYAIREYALAGGLMAFGPRMEDQFRRAAAHVAKILDGAHPADLPVERPTEFELVVNLGTAKALGIEIPPAVLARADEVIE